MEVTEIKTETVVKEMNPIMADQEKINSLVLDVALIKKDMSYVVDQQKNTAQAIKDLSVVSMEVFLQAKKDADKEHDELRKAIEDGDKNVRRDLDKIIAWKDTITSKLAYGAIIFLILVLLAVAGLEKYSPL